MPNISVRALPGRIVKTAPVGGRDIPSDRFVSLPDTQWLRHLADDHGDIEIRPGPEIVATVQAPPTTAQPAAQSVAASAAPVARPAT